MELTIEKLHAEHHQKIFIWINSKIRDKEQAEELANDVFIKAFENLEDYDQNVAKVSTWIFTIAKNLLIDYYRKRKLETTSMNNYVDEDGNELLIHTDNGNPEKEMINNQLGDKIMDAIISLPSNYQTIVDLFLIDQKSYDEIAEHLSIPLGTVKGSISRAKEMLRTRLINLK